MDNGVPSRARILAENVRGIMDYMTEHRGDVQPRTLQCVTKLYDHIELENGRAERTSRWNRGYLDRMAMLSGDMESRIQQSNDDLTVKVEEAKKLFSADMDRARKEYEQTTLAEIEKSNKALQRDYVSILGIFAAIVMAFVSGSVYSNSVLDNIANIEFYRLLFVMLCVGIFLFDLVNALFYFVLKMSGLQMGSKAKRLIIGVNIVVILMLVAFVANWFLHFLPAQ